MDMRRPKAVIAGILITLLVVIVLQNTAPQKTTILFWNITMPRAVLLFITGLIGYGLGGIFATRKKKK